MSATGESDLVWRALAHPLRRALLDELAAQHRTTGQLIDQFDSVSRVAVMKHLDILVDAGLILVRREGRVRWNWLNPVPIQQVCDRWVSRHVRGIASAMARLKEHVERAHSAQPNGDQPNGDQPNGDQPNPEEARDRCPSKKQRATATTSSRSRSRRRGSASGKP